MAEPAPKPPSRQSVDNCLKMAVITAEEELAKATARERATSRVHDFAVGLQVLLGALTTALGPALKGEASNIVIAFLGVSSTLIASTLVLLKGLKEPQTSQSRAQGLRRLLREIEEFKEDLENPMEDLWNVHIRNFRMELERLLPHGNAKANAAYARHPGSGSQPGSTEGAGPGGAVGVGPVGTVGVGPGGAKGIGPSGTEDDGPGEEDG